jgi:hypothetical protein
MMHDMMGGMHWAMRPVWVLVVLLLVLGIVALVKFGSRAFGNRSG